MATFSQQRESALFLIPPVASHKAVSKMPIPNIFNVIDRHDVTDFTRLQYFLKKILLRTQVLLHLTKNSVFPSLREFKKNSS